MILWHNATFFTLDEKNPIVTQVITNNGKIIALGDHLEYDKDIKKIDLNNKFVYPGFVDSHLHIIGYGQKLTRIDLTLCKNKQQVLKTLSKHHNKSYLYAEGYQNMGITANEIDEVIKDKWVLLRHRDYHALTVNTKVINDLNINSTTGILLENDAEDTIKKLPSNTQDDIEKMLLSSLDQLYKYGLTGGHSDDMRYFNGYYPTIDAYQTILKTKPFKANLLLANEMLKDYQKDPNYLKNQFLKLDATKIFYDGTFGSKTALMENNFINENNNGMRMYKEEDLIELIKKVRNLNLTLAIHVIGDLGLEEILNILKQYPPQKDQFDRIIHATAINKKTLKQIQNMPIMIDAQPQFLTSDLPNVLSNFSVLPQYLYPWKSYFDLNLTVAFGSDAPIEEPNPLLGIYSAVTRLGNDGIIYDEKEKITRYQAILGYTINAAKIGNNKLNGQLKIGNEADFSVFNINLLEANINLFLKNQVYATIINEKIVYKQS